MLRADTTLLDDYQYWNPLCPDFAVQGVYFEVQGKFILLPIASRKESSTFDAMLLVYEYMLAILEFSIGRLEGESQFRGVSRY
jgi:hypothetical protein